LDNTETWQPQKLIRFIQNLNTSMHTSEIETDVGFAMIKPMLESIDRQFLACEYVGASLAQLAGLKTPDFAILRIPEPSQLPIKSEKVIAGPAFVSRKIEAKHLSDVEDELLKLVSPYSFNLLVAFDTWVQNGDRIQRLPGIPQIPPGNDKNVLVTSSEENSPELWSIDFAECFICGDGINERLNQYDFTKCHSLYGLYNSFLPYIDQKLLELSMEAIMAIDQNKIKAIVNNIPQEWGIDSKARSSLNTYLLDRRQFLSEELINIVNMHLPAGSFS
jgi:hypothetical protein